MGAPISAGPTRLRIGLLTTEYPGYATTGGLGCTVRDLAHALAGLGHEVSVLLYGHAPGETGAAGKVGIVPLAVGGLPALLPAPLGRGSSIAMAFRLRRLLRELRLDVLEAPECSGMTAFLSLVHPPTKVIVRLHTAGAIVRQFDHLARSRFADWLERRAIETADAVVSNSEATRTLTRTLLRVRRSDIEVIPNPVADLFYGEGMRPAEPGPVVVFSGRLQWLKGVDVLVRAWPLVASRHPQARLLLIGEDTMTAPGGGSMLGHLRELMAAQPAGNIEFAGYLSTEALSERLRAAALAVFPSRWEGFGLACAEAMAAGVPVVVSNAEALRALVGEGVAGLVTPVDGVDELAAAINALLDDPERRRGLAAAARGRAEAFRSRTVAAQTLAVYERALRSGSRL
jgi:glycosyltransferase involved in cell wall biosynthesis